MQSQRQRRVETRGASDISGQPARHTQSHNARRNTHTSRRSPEPLQRTTRNAREVSSLRGSQRRHAREIPIYEDPVDRESTTQGQYTEPLIQPRPSRPELIYRPSETQLFRDADTYDHFRLREVLRRLIRRWKSLALAARDRRKAILRRAEAYDRRTLLRQALTELHNKYLIRKNEAETELFFRNLGDRAAQTRDTHILTKAFTHWAASTSELSEQNAVARRHIVRFRHFNAWKEITIVNELKIRRLTLQRFLDLWRRRFTAAQNQTSQAIAASNRNAVEQSYWTWFWAFCARRAPEWRDARLKHNYLLRWLVGTKAREEQNLRVDASRADALRQSLLGHWHERTRVAALQERQADDFRRRKVMSRTLGTLRGQAKFAPLVQRVQGLVNWRVASSALATLGVRAKVYARAREVNRQRTVRNAWTDWNDRLRWQTLQHQVDDRLATQALYKWVLAERAKLLTRLNQERAQERILRGIAARKRELDERLGQAEDAVTEARNTRLARASFAQWRARLNQQQQREEQAMVFLAPHATGKYMLQWHAAEELQRERERTAVETIWYFRVTRTFRTLGRKVEENVKAKRKQAYISVRRMIKMNLAGRVLETWRRRTEVVRDISAGAERIVEFRNEEIVREHLETWTRRTEGSFEMAIEAESRDNEKVLRQILGVWIEETRGWSDQVGMAEEFLRSKLERTAYDCLRRLRLKSLEVRSLEARLGWNEQRRVRGVLKGWAERTSARRRGNQQRDEAASSGDTAPLLSHGRTSLLSLTRTPRSTRSRSFFTAEAEPSLPLEPVASTTPFSVSSTALVPAVRAAVQEPRISSSSLFGRAALGVAQHNATSSTSLFPPSQQPLSQTSLQPFQPPVLSTFAPSASLSALTTPLPPHLSTPSHRAARARAFGSQKQLLARPAFSSSASVLEEQHSSTQPPSLTKASFYPTSGIANAIAPSSRNVFRQSTSHTPLSHPPPIFRTSTLLSTSRITEESEEGEGPPPSPLRSHAVFPSTQPQPQARDPAQNQNQDQDQDQDQDEDQTERQTAFSPSLYPAAANRSDGPAPEGADGDAEADSILSTYPQLSASTSSFPPAPSPSQPQSEKAQAQNQAQARSHTQNRAIASSPPPALTLAAARPHRPRHQETPPATDSHSSHSHSRASFQPSGRLHPRFPLQSQSQSHPPSHSQPQPYSQSQSQPLSQSHFQSQSSTPRPRPFPTRSVRLPPPATSASALLGRAAIATEDRSSRVRFADILGGDA